MNDNIKTGIAVATAGLVALAAVISDGITAEEWIAVALAVLAALGGGTAYAERQKTNETKEQLRIANKEVHTLRVARGLPNNEG